jgi:pyruvate formate lyase activating enzyme
VKHVEYTGVSNELALKNLAMLAGAGKEIILRFPVIPGITDDHENVEKIARLMKGLHLNRIDLLPYHSIAKDKYRRMGRDYLLPDLKEPSDDEMDRLKSYFVGKGLDVKV